MECRVWISRFREDSTTEIIEQTKGISRDGSGRLKIIVPGLPGSTEDNQLRELAPACGVSYIIDSVYVNEMVNE